MRSMYAMNVGVGMGVCGRVVENTLAFRDPEGDLWIRLTYTDGSSTTMHAHDLVDVDEHTPQRIARRREAEAILNR